jgi:hypothetical protein
MVFYLSLLTLKIRETKRELRILVQTISTILNILFTRFSGIDDGNTNCLRWKVYQFKDIIWDIYKTRILLKKT